MSVFGVVGVVVDVVASLLSLSMMYSYLLLVTGTVFLKQIQVCNVGKEFVHEWFAFWLLGALFVGFVQFTLEVHAFHGVDSFVF